MRPAESVLSKDVLEFLIEHQSYFVFGMSKRISHSRQESQASQAKSQQTPSTDTQESTAALAVPESIPEGRLSPQPLAAPRPQPVRADTDFMLPSDSDEEAPQGGYYIVERVQTPKSPTSTSRAMSPSSGGHEPSAALQSLLPQPRQARARASRRPRHSEPHPGQGVPAIGIMDPSDSDDDMPAGGYVVYENPGIGKLRHTSLVRTTSAAERPSSKSPHLGASLSRSRTATLQPGEARATSPQPPTGLLSRRRTLPTKRVGDFTARMRRAVREA